jgi:DivIVA domain-containing protein
MHGNLTGPGHSRGPRPRGPLDCEVRKLHTTDIGTREFTIARKGYDQAEVRAFLVELSTSVHSSDLDLVAIEAAARSEADRIVAAAELASTAIRDHADAYAADKMASADLALTEAEVVRAEGLAVAKARAAEAVEQSEQLLSRAEAQATARLAAAEEHARARSAEILDAAKQSLQRLLDAETDVHVRLASALSSTLAPTGHPLERDDEALLDLAFAEFFANDIEHDESRAWILSDQAG